MVTSSVSSSAKRFLSVILSVEKRFSAPLMTRSLTIFGHSKVIPTEQSYELKTLLRLANQNAGNLKTR